MMYAQVKKMPHHSTEVTPYRKNTSARHIDWLNATLLLMVVFGGTIPSTIRAYNLDTIAAFAVPALITNYLSSKRTVAHIRAKAQAMIDDYEHNNVVFTTNDIRWAYDIVKSTDKELENRVWWNATIKSALVGAFTAFVYNSIMYPGEKNKPDIHNHTHYHIHTYSLGITADYAAQPTA